MPSKGFVRLNHTETHNYKEYGLKSEIVDKVHAWYNTVESRDYAPPLCMLGLGKSGEGAYTRDPYISV